MATPVVSDLAIQRLCRYWYRAQLMRELTHYMRDEHTSENDYLRENWWEFETYLSYWLSGLFVVVEGFNKLKLKDARVQKLFKEHVSNLKKWRHETYHFAIELDPAGNKVLAELNWAEELHEAIGDYLREIVGRRETVERFLEYRKRKKK
jgi:hypothetical protein